MSTLRQQFLFLWARLRHQPLALALLGLLVAAGAAASLAGPVLLSAYINDTEGGLTRQITVAAGLYLLTAFALPLLSIGESWLATLVAWRSTNELRLELFRHCLEQDLDLLERQPPGALITRIDGDVDMLAEFLSTFVVRLLTSALILAGVLAVMARIDGRLGLVMAVFIVLCAAALQAPRGLSQRLWHAHRRASADEFGTAEDLLGGADDVRANGATAWAVEAYVRRGWATYTAGRRAQLVANASWASAQLLYGWAVAACLLLATWLFDRHALTVGTVYLVFAYAGAIQTPLQAVSRQLQLLQTAGAALARIRELLAERARVSWLASPRTIPDGAIEIDLEGVGFRYPGSAETLRGVSFHVTPGRRVGVVGRTGSGKTTVARLLLRFQDPDRGAVRLNGVDLRQAGREQLRRLVAYVPQEVQLLHASVRDNLTLFGASASDRRLREVLDVVGLSDWFASLPAGLDTPLAPGGRDLSAGQAQLLAAARAFLVDPGLLVLDEASSRIDPATERKLQAAFDRLCEGRTAFIIAHRLATVRQVDDVLVMERGRVVEFGPREDLERNPESRFAAILRGER